MASIRQLLDTLWFEMHGSYRLTKSNADNAPTPLKKVEPFQSHSQPLEIISKAQFSITDNFRVSYKQAEVGNEANDGIRALHLWLGYLALGARILGLLSLDRPGKSNANVMHFTY